MPLFVIFTDATNGPNKGQDVRVDVSKIAYIEHCEVRGTKFSKWEVENDGKTNLPTRPATKLTLNFDQKPHMGRIRPAEVIVAETPNTVESRVNAAVLEREVQIRRLVQQHTA